MFFNSSVEKYEILNRNHLKYLAIIFMIIDHISFFYDPNNPIIIACGFISRVTAPIMALFIAEGYHYTRDVKKYMKRLFLFAIISYVPFTLFMAGSFLPVQLFAGSITPHFFFASGEINPQPFVYLLNSTLVILETSVIFTLFLGLVTIYLWDKVNLPIYIKVIITLLIVWISSFSDWKFILIAMCLIFYFFKDDPKKLWGTFAIIAILSMFSVRLLVNPFYPAFSMNFELSEAGIILVPLFFALYNGKPGSKSAFHKWFFYIFYPGHLLLLGLIRILI